MKKKQDERRTRIRILHGIHAALGLFLIAGGILKLAATVAGSSQLGLLAILAVLFSVAEILGGLWMVAGYDPEQTRPWVIAAFVGLWATSAYQAITGKCSCGCFGNLSINPWFVMLFDLAAVVVLLKWDVEGSGYGDLLNSPKRVIDLSAVAVAMVLLGTLTQAPLAVAGAATLAGRPLRNVDLELRSETFQETFQTDGDGNFALPPLRPGMYAVTLFGRGEHLDPSGSSSSRPVLPRIPRKLSAKQKKALQALSQAAEEASAAADAPTNWVDLSTSTGRDLKGEYKKYRLNAPRRRWPRPPARLLPPEAGPSPGVPIPAERFRKGVPPWRPRPLRGSSCGRSGHPWPREFPGGPGRGWSPRLSEQRTP